MRRLGYIWAFLLIARPVMAAEPDIALGSRVRVMQVFPQDFWIEGHLTDIDETTLYITEDKDTIAVALSAIDRLEVRKDVDHSELRRRNMWRGAAISAGAFSAFACSTQECTPGGIAITSLVGGAMGAVAGYLSTTGWSRVDENFDLISLVGQHRANVRLIYRLD